MVVILILCVSLVIGGLWGFRQVRSHRFSFAVFLTAPVASAAFFFVVVTMMMMLDPSPAVLARPLFDRIIGYVLTGFLYGGGLGGSSGPSQHSWEAAGLNCSYFGRGLAARPSK